MTLISVIIPVYNTGIYLEKCIFSVINQTYKDLEIIIVDDGSNISTASLCDNLAKLDSRIKVIHKENGGLSSARNVGLDNSTGEYISFLDSDDYISLDFYDSLLKCADKRIVGVSHFVRIDENGKEYNRNDPHIAGGQISVLTYVRELLLHIGDVSVCTKLFSREIISSARFKEDVLNEDLLFMFEILPNIEGLAFTNKVGYFYLFRSGSISSKYGKAIEDMVANSLEIKDIVNLRYPSLKKEAARFAIFQHMCYILLLPEELRSKKNKLYVNTLIYIRRNFIKDALLNKYLTFKQKSIMLLLMAFPFFTAKIYQKRH